MPEKFNNYHLVGYAYTNKEGKDVGIHVFVAQALKKNHLVKELNPIFQHAGDRYIQEQLSVLSKVYSPGYSVKFHDICVQSVPDARKESVCGFSTSRFSTP